MGVGGQWCHCSVRSLSAEDESVTKQATVTQHVCYTVAGVWEEERQRGLPGGGKRSIREGFLEEGGAAAERASWRRKEEEHRGGLPGGGSIWRGEVPGGYHSKSVLPAQGREILPGSLTCLCWVAGLAGPETRGPSSRGPRRPLWPRTLLSSLPSVVIAGTPGSRPAARFAGEAGDVPGSCDAS